MSLNQGNFKNIYNWTQDLILTQKLVLNEQSNEGVLGGLDPPPSSTKPQTRMTDPLVAASIRVRSFRFERTGCHYISFKNYTLREYVTKVS